MAADCLEYHIIEIHNGEKDCKIYQALNGTKITWRTNYDEKRRCLWKRQVK